MPCVSSHSDEMVMIPACYSSVADRILQVRLCRVQPFVLYCYTQTSDKDPQFRCVCRCVLMCFSICVWWFFSCRWVNFDMSWLIFSSFSYIWSWFPKVFFLQMLSYSCHIKSYFFHRTVKLSWFLTAFQDIQWNVYLSSPLDAWKKYECMKTHNYEYSITGMCKYRWK